MCVKVRVLLNKPHHCGEAYSVDDAMRVKVRVLLNKPHYCGEAYSVD